MRIGMIGAGAMGGTYGGLLAEAGADVHLFDSWTDHVEAIRANGLTIDRPADPPLTVDIPATTDPADIGPVDLAVVFVKAHQIEDALPMAAPMIDDDTVVVTLQNGLDHIDRIAAFVPRERILGGATTFGAEVRGPGHVRLAGRGMNKLGGPDRGAADRVADTFTAAGLATEVVDDPEAHIWHKQFTSVGLKPVAALTELLDGPIAEFGPTWSVVETLITEAIDVARARDIPVLGDPIADTRELCLEVVYDARSSMLEDVLNERPTEIDAINGAVVAYGESAGVPTPMNRMATALVKGKERSYRDDSD